MRAVVQRVKRAQVTVNGEITGKIDRGLLVFVGVAHNDAEAMPTIWQTRSSGCESSKMRMER